MSRMVLTLAGQESGAFQRHDGGVGATQGPGFRRKPE